MVDEVGLFLIGIIHSTTVAPIITTANRVVLNIKEESTKLSK